MKFYAPLSNLRQIQENPKKTGSPPKFKVNFLKKRVLENRVSKNPRWAEGCPLRGKMIKVELGAGSYRLGDWVQEA